jgi:hypothetical protein
LPGTQNSSKLAFRAPPWRGEASGHALRPRTTRNEAAARRERSERSEQSDKASALREQPKKPRCCHRWVVLAFPGWFGSGCDPGASGGTADALASGASVRKDVGVQIPPRALTSHGVAPSQGQDGHSPSPPESLPDTALILAACRAACANGRAAEAATATSSSSPSTWIRRSPPTGSSEL